jgi:hypothetical protein
MSSSIDTEIANLRARIAELEKEKMEKHAEEMLTSWVPELCSRKAAEDREKRSAEAFCAHVVDNEAAKLDLIRNPDSPFLFRKWLVLQSEQAPAYMRELKDAGKPEVMTTYIGRKVIDLIGCKCGNNTYFDIHPEVEYTYSSIKALKGPCSSWYGHTGYCWEGTMCYNSSGEPIPARY